MDPSPRPGAQPNLSGDIGFNPYHKWLGIRDGSPPYDHYMLLGLSPLEDDPEVISNAADRQMRTIKDYDSKFGSLVAKINGELSTARTCLLNAEKKEVYDVQLRISQKRTTASSQRPGGPAAVDTTIGKWAVADTPPDSVAPHRPLHAPPPPPSPAGPPMAVPTPLKPSPTQPQVVTSASRPSSHTAASSKQLINPWIMVGAPLVAACVLLIVVIAGVLSRGNEVPTVASRPTDPSGSQLTTSEETRLAEEARERARQEGVDQENARQAARLVEEARVAEEARLAEQARLAEEARRAGEQIRREEQRREEEQLRAEQEILEAEAARIELSRNAWEKYQEYRTSFAGSSTHELLENAQSEPDPATRAGIAFLAFERAVGTGDLEIMNAAMGIITNPSVEHGYDGMHPYDALIGQNIILARSELHRLEPQTRLALMQDLIEKTWLAYDHGDYALAEKLTDKAKVCSRGLSAADLTEERPEERPAALEQLRTVRQALADAEARTERFVGLSEAADNGSTFSAALLSIEKAGDWATAVDYLIESDNEAVATAARLDKSDPEGLIDLLSVAQAWRGAAASDSANASHWNHRCAAQLARAKEAAVTEGPGGAAALELINDISTLAANLATAGVDLNSQAGMQGFVAGRGIENLIVDSGDNAPSTPGGLEGRRDAARDRLVREGGGTEESEAAVAASLLWIVNHQNGDGSWDFNHQGRACLGLCENPGALAGTANLGATAMALLPLLGAGNTHQRGEYKDNVQAGLTYLVSHMKVETGRGSLMDEGTMYSHGLATIALCEAYAMTQDRGLRDPAQFAINHIIYAQDPNGGGWRYGPREPGDTSVLGWQLAALKTAHMADLNVPVETIRGANIFLDSVQSGELGSRFGYMTNTNGSSALTAIGLLSRMHLGWEHDYAGLRAGVEFLSSEGPSSYGVYYNYYATQVMYHYGGEMWTQWNEVMRDQLVDGQETEGHAQGSWYQGGDRGSSQGGRLYITAMSTMVLEVYYRHLPLYSQEEGEAVDEGEAVHIVATWDVVDQDGNTSTFTLHSDRKAISSNGGVGRWSILGNKLRIRWPNEAAPGGAWLDGCTISDDGKTFSGENQDDFQFEGTLRE